MTIVHLALALLAGPTACALYLLRRRVLRRRVLRAHARAQHPSQRWTHLLETPVRIPHGPDYPDRWTNYPDADDVRLAALHNRTWPKEEWQTVAACPHLSLVGHTTWAAAELARDRGRPSRIKACGCGLIHIHYRQRRVSRTRTGR